MPDSGARWPQVGHKALWHMRLHADMVLDLVERTTRGASPYDIWQSPDAVLRFLCLTVVHDGRRWGTRDYGTCACMLTWCWTWLSALRAVQIRMIFGKFQMLLEIPMPDSGARWPQVAHKGMLYMQLHAEAVLDLVERAPREVQFRAVSGDFQVLQGKFIVSQPIEVPPCRFCRYVCEVLQGKFVISQPIEVRPCRFPRKSRKRHSAWC